MPRLSRHPFVADTLKSLVRILAGSSDGAKHQFTSVAICKISILEYYNVLNGEAE